jgi:hypothetical protein
MPSPRGTNNERLFLQGKLAMDAAMCSENASASAKELMNYLADKGLNEDELLRVAELLAEIEADPSSSPIGAVDDENGNPNDIVNWTQRKRESEVGQDDDQQIWEKLYAAIGKMLGKGARGAQDDPPARQGGAEPLRGSSRIGADALAQRVRSAVARSEQIDEANFARRFPDADRLSSGF